MPRCEKCHSQWATYFRCPHCEQKFPCPLQLLLVSIALLVAVIAGIYLLLSFQDKVEDWLAMEKNRPAEEKGLTVEIDKSNVE